MRYFNYQKEIQPQRDTLFQSYLSSVSGTLLTWAEKRGIWGPNEPIKLWEIFSRITGEKAIRQVKGKDCAVKQLPLTARYDMEVDGIPVENKFRLNDKDQYDTDDISEHKASFMASISGLIISTSWEGESRCYDANAAIRKDADWEHYDTTAYKRYKKKEGRWQYASANTEWITTITLPDEFN